MPGQYLLNAPQFQNQPVDGVLHVPHGRRWIFVHEGTQLFKCIRRAHHLLLYFLPRKVFSALETSLQPTHQNVVTQSQAQSRDHFQARHVRIVYIEVTLVTECDTPRRSAISSLVRPLSSLARRSAALPVIIPKSVMLFSSQQVNEVDALFHEDQSGPFFFIHWEYSLLHIVLELVSLISFYMCWLSTLY